jgi:hypothetical protein
LHGLDVLSLRYLAKQAAGLESHGGKVYGSPVYFLEFQGFEPQVQGNSEYQRQLYCWQLEGEEVCLAAQE